MTLPTYLREVQLEIEGYGRDYGLDFYRIMFEVLDYKRMNEVAAYGGFPTRYPHWRFGMEYESLQKSHVYGLSKIYEMVINNVPSYAYLLEGNSMVDQKMVMAHVCGHVDFFKNNYFFSKTNRKMVDGMANHATRVRKHIDRIGLDKVEGFIDVMLTLDNLIDPLSPFITRRPKKGAPVASSEEEVETEAPDVPRLRAKSYMDKFINPPEYMAKQRQKVEKKHTEKAGKFPEHPERDILLFLLEHAPLEKWERDIVEIVRDEAYYFAPQGQTKILNEGWATYWHSRIMTERALKASEVIDYADHASGVVSAGQGQLNPYKLGVELLRHIEDRWNKGQFGKEWEDCDRLDTRRSWDKKLGLGRRKIFEVRKLYSDVTFIDEFFTEEFCREHRYFNFGFNDRSNNWEIESREFKKIKERLLFQLTNFGQPFIFVEDGNFENRGELLLKHRHEGTDLRLDYARDTLVSLYRVWKRPVNLLSRIENKGRILRFDGKDHSEKSADAK